MSERENEARKRLQGRTWNGLEAMFAGYAAEATAMAQADFHETLAYDQASLSSFERILNRLCPAPASLPLDDGEWLTLLWGSWFGELLRQLHGGSWAMTVYPGSEFSVPTLEINGSRLYPMMKVHRRLTLGASESLPAFYNMLRDRLVAAAGPGR